MGLVFRVELARIFTKKQLFGEVEKSSSIAEPEVI